MPSRPNHRLMTLPGNIVLLGGSAATNATGTATTTSKGGAFVVTESSTGTYRITLGRSTSEYDRYHSLVGAIIHVTDANGRSYAGRVIAEDVDGAVPYIDFVVGPADPGGVNAGNYPHALCATTLITAPDASDLATLKTLVADICTIVEAHDDSTTMHAAADTGNLGVAAWASTPGEPADLAECEACLDEVKADWNTHRVVGPLGTVHYGGDAYSEIDAAAATNQATSETLANQIKLRLNRSLQAAPDAPIVPSNLASATVYIQLMLSKSAS